MVEFLGGTPSSAKALLMDLEASCGTPMLRNGVPGTSFGVSTNSAP